MKISSQYDHNPKDWWFERSIERPYNIADDRWADTIVYIASVLIAVFVIGLWAGGAL
jgi:hypothetical protein